MKVSGELLPPRNGFVAAHAGAGCHARAKEAEYCSALRSALAASSAILAAGGSALDAVAAGAAAMEVFIAGKQSCIQPARTDSSSRAC